MCVEPLPAPQGTRGELGVLKFFADRGIPTITQWPVSVPGHTLRCDVYVPSLRLIVEFDGIQHYTFPNYFHKTRQEFQRAQRRDVLKVQYAIDQGLRIVHLDYSYVSAHKLEAAMATFVSLPHKLIVTDRKKYAYLLRARITGIRDGDVYVHP
jgi:very-short-patch-repair endonuclease